MVSDDSLGSLPYLDTLTRSSVSSRQDSPTQRAPGLTLLAHPDLRRIGERAVLTALSSGQEVLLSRLEPAFAQPGSAPRRPLADPHLSRRALRIAPTEGGIALANESGLRISVDGEPLVGRKAFPEDAIEQGIVLLLADRVALLLHTMEILTTTSPRHGLVGESGAIQTLRQQVIRVADLEVPVLLRGETGTGKELVANAIHELSGRRGGPFVGVNMGAVPSTLAASELFGATKGAFTGADRERRGYFAQADGGTLFLDEVGETPSEVQALLLRTLETGIVQAVGAAKPRRVDVRILAATDADLEAAIAEGQFRAPLLHRLAGYEIRLPALRERRDDLGRLLIHFLRQEMAALGEDWRSDPPEARRPWVRASLVARLALYPWPGNVRQLHNVARQLVIDNRGADQLQLTDELVEMLASFEKSPAELAQSLDLGVEAEEKIVPERRARRPATSASRPASDEDDRYVLRTLLALRWVRPDPQTDDDATTAPVGAERSRAERLVRSLLVEYDGHEVDRSDDLLLIFERPIDAIGLALEVQQSLSDRMPQASVGLQAQIGIHLGEVHLSFNAPEVVARGAKAFEVKGHPKTQASHLAKRARPGQTLLTHSAHDLARQALHPRHPLAVDSVRWLSHGQITLATDDDPTDLFEVGLEGLAPFAAPPPSQPANETSPPTYRSPGEIDEETLLQALRQHDFRLLPTAKALRISRASLYVLIDRSPHIRKAADLSREEIEASRRRCADDRAAMARDLEVSRKGLSRRMSELGFLNN